MTIGSLPPDVAANRLTAPGAAKPKDDAARTLDAAKQFEGLLIGQMLKSVRESGSSWLGTGEDQAGESAMALAEENLANALAKTGGLGLAGTIVSGLGRKP